MDRSAWAKISSVVEGCVEAELLKEVNSLAEVGVPDQSRKTDGLKESEVVAAAGSFECEGTEGTGGVVMGPSRFVMGRSATAAIATFEVARTKKRGRAILLNAAIVMGSDGLFRMCADEIAVVDR